MLRDMRHNAGVKLKPPPSYRPWLPIPLAPYTSVISSTTLVRRVLTSGLKPMVIRKSPV
jgi:hypothetical protein